MDVGNKVKILQLCYLSKCVAGHVSHSVIMICKRIFCLASDSAYICYPDITKLSHSLSSQQIKPMNSERLLYPQSAHQRALMNTERLSNFREGGVEIRFK